jgi:hypothetical protein
LAGVKQSQQQSKTKIPTIAGTLPNNGVLLNQHCESQEELEAAARVNTAALIAKLKPDGWTASEKTTFHESATPGNREKRTGFSLKMDFLTIQKGRHANRLPSAARHQC